MCLSGKSFNLENMLKYPRKIHGHVLKESRAAGGEVLPSWKEERVMDTFTVLGQGSLPKKEVPGEHHVHHR